MERKYKTMTYGFTKGVIIGTVTGAAIGMMVNPMRHRRCGHMGKKAGSVSRIIGNILEDVFS